jgi:hypothetical protein
MEDNPKPSYPAGQAAGALSRLGGPPTLNPTLRENIEAKIQYYKDEIVRLEKVKAKMEFMLDVNLRDLREAMNI